MSSEPYESRLDEVLRKAGLPPADHITVDAMADQMVVVTDEVAQWDSPGLYQIEGARQKCLAVLKAHRFIGTEGMRYSTAQWDLIGEDVLELPPFDPNDPNQASVPRVIFAANPRSVRICRGTVYDSLTGVLLNIAQKPTWTCDWGNGHDIKPAVWIDPDTGEREVTHSKPYLVTKSMGEFLLVFVVCTQCLEDLIGENRAANERDRELIDGVWEPIWRNPHPSAVVPGNTAWMTSDDRYPENHTPAAYLLNGIRFVIPHRHSGWREDDPRTYDYLPH